MSAVLSRIAEFSQSIINIMADGKEIYQTVVSYMDSVEELGVLKGEDKLKWVLAKLQDVITGYDAWRDRIVNFINAIKSAYNSAKVLFG